MKPVQLTESEIANAEERTSGKYTIVRRPQAKGGYWVAAIDVATGAVITEEYADTKSDVRKAVKEVNRWMDKCYGGGKMSWTSRTRPKN